MEKIEMKQMVQLGIVVEDAKSAMDRFCELFNVPEEYTILIHVKEGENNSRFTADFAWVNYGGVQFEFIQPISGDLDTYDEFLKLTGGGIHHMAFTVEDPVEIIRRCREGGLKEITPGSDGGKLLDPALGYFDLHREMGLRFEVNAKKLDILTKISFASMK